MEYYRPMSSSPILGDDSTPSGSQDRSDRNHSSEDHARKRRRVETAGTHPITMADPTRLPHYRRSAFPSHYDFIPSGLNGFPSPLPVGLPMGTFMEEDEALAYLTAGTGFAQDLNNMAYAQTPLPFITPEQSVQAAALTSHPSHAALRQQQGLSLFRPLPDDYLPPMQPRLAIPTRPREDDQDTFGTSSSVVPTSVSFEFADPPVSRPQTYPPHMQIIDGIPPPPVRRGPPASNNEVSKKPATMLVLSRATEESIQAIDEHKRECPTCCLEFEPENFVAVIKCCDMAMHARCLSAWVNSPGYSKSRACMKCRRPIDAKHMLNKVISPVTDKDWDEGGDFNAPESLKQGGKIELNISARPTRPGHRHGGPMNYLGYRGTRITPLPIENLTPEQRLSILRLRGEQVAQLEEFRTRRSVAMENSNRLNHEEHEANRILVDAQHHASEEEMTALHQGYRQTKAASDQAREVYERVRVQFEALQRAQGRRVFDMVEEFHVEREAREREARAREVRNRTEAEQLIAEATGEDPQLRVVNGEESGSSSP